MFPMNKMTTLSRILTAVASISLIATLFLPIWKIEMSAPQYPEGLEMKIWLNKMSGDVDVINGLNHYIGMRHIVEDEFVEFKVLPYIVIAMTIIGIAIALIGKSKGVYAFAAVLILFGIVALVDFYRWGYDYGHNLDPTAPIQVPGMAYQPPLIGYKQLLNFGAFSIPDIGGWIFAASGLLILFASWYEWYKNRAK
jgi:copper chaperone NosL